MEGSYQKRNEIQQRSLQASYESTPVKRKETLQKSVDAASKSEAQVQ